MFKYIWPSEKKLCLPTKNIKNIEGKPTIKNRINKIIIGYKNENLWISKKS